MGLGAWKASGVLNEKEVGLGDGPHRRHPHRGCRRHHRQGISLSTLPVAGALPSTAGVFLI